MCQERKVGCDALNELFDNTEEYGCGYRYQKANKYITCKYNVKEMFSILKISFLFILKASFVKFTKLIMACVV